MEKVLDIIDSIAHEKGIKSESVKEALKIAMIRTAQRLINEDYAYKVEIDELTKKAQLFQTITVVPDDSEELEEKSEAYISLSEAKELDEDVEVGDELQYEHDIEKMGRTAAANLHRELEFHIQRLVEDELYNKYKNMIGTVMSGTVARVDNRQDTYIEMQEVRGVLPMKNRIKGEIFKQGEVVKAVIRRVNIDKAHGIYIELSRTSPRFLEELLRSEVPEIKDDIVIIEKSARIPGERAKIALLTTSAQVDPVGATVGVKGVRINAVSAELENESIDCIEYTSIPEMFISRALSPAIIGSVSIESNNEESRKAVVTLPSDQKSKAIGRSGINIRLASMLTGFDIELVEQDSSGLAGMIGAKKEEKVNAEDALGALFND